MYYRLEVCQRLQISSESSTINHYRKRKEYWIYCSRQTVLGERLLSIFTVWLLILGHWCDPSTWAKINFWSKYTLQVVLKNLSIELRSKRVQKNITWRAMSTFMNSELERAYASMWVIKSLPSFRFLNKCYSLEWNLNDAYWQPESRTVLFQRMWPSQAYAVSYLTTFRTYKIYSSLYLSGLVCDSF